MTDTAVDIAAVASERGASGLGSGPRRGSRHRCARRVVWIAVLALAAVCLGRTAEAQERKTLNGAWSASALTEAWAIGDWGDACGPKPRPQGAGGGGVQIREQGGELLISGAGRAFSTAECWEQMPGLSRTSHSASGGGRFWRTRCSTPANDPRRATVVTTIQATDSTISLTETGQYQFVIQDTNCTASVTRSRSFSLSKREGEETPAPSAEPSAAAPTASASAPPPPAPPPTAEPKPTKPQCPAGASGSGEPARLEVRPTRKLLRPGERFGFRAVVLDADGCPLVAKPTWTVSGGSLANKASVDATGTVQIAADAGEGKVDVAAMVGGKGVTVSIEVASAEHYDEQLSERGLGPSGEDGESAVAVIATGSIGGRAGVAEDSAKQRKQLFIAIVGALAAVLGLAGIVLWRRGRRSAEAEDERASSAAEPAGDGHAASNGGAGHAGARASDAGRMASAAAGVAVAAEDAARAPGAGARPPPAAAKRGKICPTCGERYGGEAEFCGKDGTALVMIN